MIASDILEQDDVRIETLYVFEALRRTGVHVPRNNWSDSAYPWNGSAPRQAVGDPHYIWNKIQVGSVLYPSKSESTEGIC